MHDVWNKKCRAGSRGGGGGGCDHPPFDFDNRSVTQAYRGIFACDPVVVGCIVVFIKNGQWEEQ